MFDVVGIEPLRELNFRQVGLQAHRIVQRVTRDRALRFGRLPPAVGLRREPRRIRPRKGKRRIESDGVLEESGCFRPAAAVAFVKERHAAQIGVVGGRHRGRLQRDRLLFLRRHRRAQRGGDGDGDFALDAEDVVELAVVDLGPQMPVGRSLDQLDVDAHRVAFALHAAFQNVGDAELPCELAQIAGPALRCAVDVREMTLSEPIFASRVRISSWMPTAKNAVSFSELKFSNGSTATEAMRRVALGHKLRQHQRQGDGATATATAPPANAVRLETRDAVLAQ